MEYLYDAVIGRYCSQPALMQRYVAIIALGFK